ALPRPNPAAKLSALDATRLRLARVLRPGPLATNGSRPVWHAGGGLGGEEARVTKAQTEHEEIVRTAGDGPPEGGGSRWSKCRRFLRRLFARLDDSLLGHRTL